MYEKKYKIWGTNIGISWSMGFADKEGFRCNPDGKSSKWEALMCTDWRVKAEVVPQIEMFLVKRNWRWQWWCKHDTIPYTSHHNKIHHLLLLLLLICIQPASQSVSYYKGFVLHADVVFMVSNLSALLSLSHIVRPSTPPWPSIDRRCSCKLSLIERLLVDLRRTTIYSWIL